MQHKFRRLTMAAVAGASLALSIVQPGYAQSASRFELLEATVDGIHAAMRSGQLTCTQLVQSYLDRIAAYDQAGPRLNAVQNVHPRALQQAADLDAKFKATGRLTSLHCIPVMLKDQVETDFMPTTYGSAMFKTFVPMRNATVVERLQDAGALILAKTNLGEFAAGGAGSAFGECHNAYNPAYHASGSSCGTGVAVAANFGAVGIGEDTAGSARGPASHGSLVGLRPTTPLVSRFGVMPQGPSRDTLGPITRTVKDAAIVLDVIAGYDPKDPVTAATYGRTPASYTAFLQPNGLRGMRLGVIRAPMARETDTSAPDYKEVRSMVDRAVADLRSRGAEVVDALDIPDLMNLLERSGTPSSTYETEFYTNEYLAQHPNASVRTYKEIVESPLLVESRRKSMVGDLGHRPTDPAFLQQLQAREVLRTQILKVMADHRLDAVIYATFDHAPTRLPRAAPGSNRLMSTFTGFPALTVPGGFASDGLPLGLEFMGRPFDEGVLFKAAYDFEQSTRHRRPPSTTPALAH